MKHKKENVKGSLPRIMYDQAVYAPPYLIGAYALYLDSEVYQEVERLSGYAPDPWYLYAQCAPDEFFFGAYTSEAMERESEAGYRNFTDAAFTEQFEKDAEQVLRDVRRIWKVYTRDIYGKERALLKDDSQRFIAFFQELRDILHFAMPRYLLTQPQRLNVLEEEVRAFPQSREIELLLKNGRRLTCTSQTRKLILELARAVSTSRCSAGEYLRTHSKWKDRINRMTEEIGFLNWTFLGGKIIDAAHVEEEVDKLLATPASFETEEREIKARLAELAEREQILKQNAENRTYQLADIAGHLPVLRFDMNAYIVPLMSYFEFCIPEIRDAFSVSNDAIHALMFNEVVELVSTGHIPISAEEIERRRYGYLVEFADHKGTVYVGRQARDHIKELLAHRQEEIRVTKEVSGTVASFPNKQQPLIEGEAVVFRGLEGWSESSPRVRAQRIAAFPEGAILVATQTHPDIVPAMKKAAAIVTDEGGLTCHAAIVSRELGKPCIIGTRIGTKIFKDGDALQVDLRNGTVRPLR